MLIRPELEALRGDVARQRRIQSHFAETLTEWREQAGLAGLEEALAGFAAGNPLSELPVLAALFVPGGSAARELSHGFVARLGAALAREPLGQVPLRHYTDDLVTTLVLARGGNASLCLQAIDGAALARHPVPRSVSFAPGQTREVVLTGQGTFERVRLIGLRPNGAKLRRERCELRASMVSVRDGASEVLLAREVPGSLVTLKLQRRAARGDIVREYRLSDGELVHQAAANPQDSRLELAAALLGRMRRRDSAPLLAAIACEAGSPSLRWQALRECLGLDTATGIAALGEIAARVADPLAAPAAALQAQLLATYPQLKEAAACHA